MSLKVRQLTLAAAYAEFNTRLATIDAMVERLREDCAGGAVDVRRFWAYIDTVNKWLPELTAILQLPGMPAYITANGGSSTPGADYQAVRNALFNLRDAIVTMLPKDANGFELSITTQPDGSRVYREFPQVTTAPLLALCDAASSLLV